MALTDKEMTCKLMQLHISSSEMQLYAPCEERAIHSSCRLVVIPSSFLSSSGLVLVDLPVENQCRGFADNGKRACGDSVWMASACHRNH